MHVIVDRTRQHVKSARIERLGSGWHDGVITDRDDPAILNGDAGLDDTVGTDNLA